MTRSPSDIFLGHIEGFDSPCAQDLPAYSTCGNFATEQEACQAFDEAVERSGAFIAWREVTGEMVHVLPGNGEKQRYRIDRVLKATDKLKKAGWSKGLIGVEIKRSNIKAGPPLAQMFDYRHCAFKDPDNVDCLLSYVFLFPLEKTHGTVASMMAQKRTGTCCLKYGQNSEWHRLEFFLGEQSVILCYLNTGEIRVANLNVGNRTGSR